MDELGHIHHKKKKKKRDKQKDDFVEGSKSSAEEEGNLVLDSESHEEKRKQEEAKTMETLMYTGLELNEGSPRKKKKKHKREHRENVDSVEKTPCKKKKKHKGEHAENIESNEQSLGKKKKHKGEHEENVESTEPNPIKKKKHKGEHPENVESELVWQTLSKKKKHKGEHAENVESSELKLVEQTPSKTKKKRHKEDNEGNVQSTELAFLEQTLRKKKHKAELANSVEQALRKKENNRDLAQLEVEEMDMEEDSSVDQRTEKKKIKNKNINLNDFEGNEITLTMLSESNTNLISEFADKGGFGSCTTASKNKTQTSSENKKLESDVAKVPKFPSLNDSTHASKNQTSKKEKKVAFVNAMLSKLNNAQSETNLWGSATTSGLESVGEQDSETATNTPSKSKMSRKSKPGKIGKTNITTVIEDLDESDIDGQLEPSMPSTNSKKKATEPKPLSAFQAELCDPSVMEWLNGLENDMHPEVLDWEPPALHTKSHQLRGLSPTLKQQLKDEGIPFRIGKWTPKEDNILKENLTRFVQKYSIPSIAIILGINKRAKEKVPAKVDEYLKLKKFYLQLGQDLPNRALYSIYKRARLLFHPMSKEKLNSEELQMLFRLQAKLGNKWSTISEIMQKPGRLLADAARYYNEKRDSGDWSPEESNKLLSVVRKKLVLKEDGTFKHLSWKKIAAKVGTRNASQCYKHWMYRLCWKFNHGDEEKPVWTSEDSLRLINYLYHSEAETEADIDWDSLFSKFSNMASYSELLNKWYNIKSQVPNYKEKDLEDILLHLRKKYKLEVKIKRGKRKQNNQIPQDPEEEVIVLE